jgi:hypothetical protein
MDGHWLCRNKFCAFYDEKFVLRIVMHLWKRFWMLVSGYWISKGNYPSFDEVWT